MIYDKVKECLAQQINLTKKFVLALSWWVDSLLLFHYIEQYMKETNIHKKNMIIVSLDHNIRQESSQEVSFLKNYCKEYTFETSTYLAEDKTERWLRNRRHSELIWFAKKHWSDLILLGHHLDDRIESFMLNLRRGAALPGMICMKMLDNSPFDPSIQLLRPLLSFNKATIIQEADKLQLPYFVDYTNLDSIISERNKLRNEIMPWFATNTTSAFYGSMEQLFSYLETLWESKMDAIKLRKMRCPAHWNALMFAEVEAKVRNKDTVSELFKITNCYKNITKKNLEEISSFLNKSRSGHKYLSWLTIFIAHSKVYVIQGAMNCWLNTLRKSDIKFWTQWLEWKHVRLAHENDKVHAKNWWKYCINKKIPIFVRNIIPVAVDEENQIITVYDNKRKQIEW